MPNSNALAVETRSVVTTFLSKWVDAHMLSYKFSVHAETSQQNRNKVQVAFSKPTPKMPAPPAAAHFCFHLDDSLQKVKGFTVESDPHFHDLDDIRFDERVIDQVIKRKLLLKQQNLVNLNDEFSSTRVPSAIKAREDEKRARERENLEEYLLDMFQRKDPYNDDRIPFTDFREVLLGVDLPGLSGQQQRHILFAFVEQDRDEMVDYASFVPIAADVVYTLTHGEHQAAESKADAKDGDSLERLLEAEEAYHVLAAREVDYTIQKLNKLIQSQDQQQQPDSSVVSAVESRDASVVSSDSSVSLEAAAQDDAKASENKDEQCQEPGSGGDAPVDESSQEKPSIYVTSRQLRSVLESTQLLISKGEINLILALAEVSPSGKILSSQLGELYPRVRSLIFQYQHQCFADRIEKYLLQQFTNFESSNLRGSAEHLRFKLKPKELLAVMKDMNKLLLTPYQAMQLLSSTLGDASRDPDRFVNYKDCVPHMARFLHDQVNLDLVINRAEMLRTAQELDATPIRCISGEDVLKRSSLECFEQLDQRKLGVLSTDDFFTSLRELSKTQRIDLDEKSEMSQLNALADPNGSGRVNYLFFVHIMYPLLRFLQQERLIECGRGLQQRQDEKLCDRMDLEGKDLK